MLLRLSDKWCHLISKLIRYQYKKIVQITYDTGITIARGMRVGKFSKKGQKDGVTNNENKRPPASFVLKKKAPERQATATEG